MKKSLIYQRFVVILQCFALSQKPPFLTQHDQAREIGFFSHQNHHKTYCKNKVAKKQVLSKICNMKQAPHTQEPQVPVTSLSGNSSTEVLRSEFFARVRSTIKNPMELLPLLEKAFPAGHELPEILAQLDDLKRCLDSFRPLDEAQLKNLLEAWDIKYTYESNRIEGNSLTLRETQLVVTCPLLPYQRFFRESGC